MWVSLDYMDSVAKGGGGIEEFEVGCSHDKVSNGQTVEGLKHKVHGHF